MGSSRKSTTSEWTYPAILHFNYMESAGVGILVSKYLCIRKGVVPVAR